MAIPPLHTFDSVCHIGTWPEAPDTNRKPGRATSYEGIGLSVSTHPDAWRAIVKLGGYPYRWLERRDGKPGRFVDGHAARREAHEWAVRRGWLVGVPGWVVSWEDDEMEDTMMLELFDHDEALDEAGDHAELRPATIWVAAGELLRRLDAHYGRQPNNQHGALDGELLNRWTAAVYPDLDGVWWDNALDEIRLSAPGGLILPESLSGWHVARSDAPERR